MLTVQNATDHQKQFQAAVDVIQRLPKNGPYRPSYEVMLRFYSYYKQATLGRCNIPRPGFWDPIGRYKWDAWNGLGGLTQDEAMAAYIREMKRVAQKVIDTVPMEETSSEMFHYFEPLYEVIPDMPRPPEYFFKEKNGSWVHNCEANSYSSMKETNENHVFEVVSAESKWELDCLAPLGEEPHHLKRESHCAKPDENGYILAQLVEEEEKPETVVMISQRNTLELEETLESDTEVKISQTQTPSQHLEEKIVGDMCQKGDTVDYSQVTSDSETEVFCDSLDQLELDQDSTLLDFENDYKIHSETFQSAWGSEPKNSAGKRPSDLNLQVRRRGSAEQRTSEALQRVQSERELQCVRDFGRDNEGMKLHTEMNRHVTATVRRLQEDMQTLQLRLSHLEAMMAAKDQTDGLCTPHWNITAKKPWWQSLEASGSTLLFLVLWPFFVQWLVHKFRSRKR